MPRYANQPMEIVMSDTPAPPEMDGQCETTVTEMVSITEQIGRNVMAALNDPDAVAVLTTLVPGMGGDRVVSLGLTDEQMHQVGILMHQIQEEDEAVADDEERCIGFQCRLPKS